jgi:hypothetical protein
MLTDLRKLLSVPFGVVVPETERMEEFGRLFPPREGLVGGRSLEGEGDALLWESETVDNGFNFRGGSEDRLPVGALLAWLDDRGRAD